MLAVSANSDFGSIFARDDPQYRDQDTEGGEVEKIQGRVPIYIRNVLREIEKKLFLRAAGHRVGYERRRYPNCAISGKSRNGRNQSPHETCPMFVTPRREWRPITCLDKLKPKLSGLRHSHIIRKRFVAKTDTGEERTTTPR